MNPSSLTILLILTLTYIPSPSHSDCRTSCGSVPVHYPFGIDDGCGAPQFRHMFTCNTTSPSLFFITENGNYKVQSINYKAQTVTVYDPDMSTCNILQPHHDVVLSDLQYAIIPPSPDTVFALLNCSVNSPLLHRFRSLCFDLPGHQCQDLYSSCNSFRVFTGGGSSSIQYGAPVAPGLGAPVAPYNVHLNNVTNLGFLDNAAENFPIVKNIPPSGLPNTGVPAPGLPDDTGVPSGTPSGVHNSFPIFNNPPPSQGDTGVPNLPIYNYPPPSEGNTGVPSNLPIYSYPPPGTGDTGVPGNLPIYNYPPPSQGDTGVPGNLPIYSYPPPSEGDTGVPSNLPTYNYPPPDLGGTGVPFYGTPSAPNNFPVYNNPPPSEGGYYGAPSVPTGVPNFPPVYKFPPPGLGDTGSPSGGNYYGAPGAPSSMGAGEPVTSAPPCCFTGYSTMKVMRMDILDCTHFTSFYNVDKLKGVSPMEWSYGLKFSFSVPDMGCDRCRKSGGSCGFDVESEALLCLCENSNNSTRQCGTEDLDSGERWAPLTVFQACIIAFGVFFFLLSDSTMFSTFLQS